MLPVQPVHSLTHSLTLIPRALVTREEMSGFTGGSIVLTAEEERIFRVLRETAREGGGKTVLRVAGGWVRDKVSE